jgi:tetratricopeptide (TPR) repeat protein
MKTFACTLLVTLILVVVPASADVTGEIANTEGKTVAGTTVALIDASGNTVWSGAANKKGKFDSDLSVPGIYTVRLDADGYATTETQIELKEGMNSKLKLVILNNAQMAQNVFNDGVAALQKGDLDGAKEILHRAVELDPSLPNPYQGLAIIESSQSNWEEAAAAIAKTRELAPGQPLVPALIVYQTALKTGNAEWQADALGQLVGTPDAKDAAVFIYNQGVTKVKDDPAAALVDFEESLKLDPQLAKPYQSIAALAFNDKKYNDAVPILKKLLEIDPSNKAGLRMSFFSHATLGNMDDATGAFAGWSKADPDAGSEVLKQAEAFFGGNQFDEAMALAKPMVQGQPSNAKGHYLVGRILAAKGDNASAKKSLAEFLKLAPNDPEAAAAKAMLEAL